MNRDLHFFRTTEPYRICAVKPYGNSPFTGKPILIDVYQDHPRNADKDGAFFFRLNGVTLAERYRSEAEAIAAAKNYFGCYYEAPSLTAELKEQSFR